MTPAPRVLIVGGVAGGASAAARLRRLSEAAEIILFERGPHISFANCGMPYHIGGTIPDRQRLLVQTPESLGQRFNLDIHVRTEVLAVDRAAKELLVRHRPTGREWRERYDALVLSPGAEPVRPPLPGIDHPRILTLRTLEDMDRIREATRHARSVLVVGGGFIGLEMVEALHALGLQVSLVEREDHVLSVADADMTQPLQDTLRRHGVHLHLGASVTSFAHQDSGLAATLSTGTILPADAVIVAVGVRPETHLAREAGLALGPTGGILVDDQMRTSDPSIFAVGDAVEIRKQPEDVAALIPLAGPANRQGRVAADAILGRPSRYTGTQGSAIVKVFDRTFAMTGATEQTLRRAGRAFHRTYIHAAHHATYYPDAHPLTLKLLFSPGDGRILGAQAVGAAGVDKRMDVLAMALRAGMTVYDLEEQELCYAPPYGSAKDPINMAGFVAANVLRGDVALWEPESEPSGPDQVLLDVRTLKEFRAGTIPNAQHAPVDELRDRLEHLDPTKEYLVFCQVGLRGYLACRQLTQHGFRARNLSGGYLRWLMAQSALPKMAPVTDLQPNH